MDAQILEWLSAVSGTVFRLAAGLFVAVNLLAAGALALTRSREVVNRWTSPWIAANLALLVAGIGVPLLIGLTKFLVQAIAGTGGFLVRLAE